MKVLEWVPWEPFGQGERRSADALDYYIAMRPFIMPSRSSGWTPPVPPGTPVEIGTVFGVPVRCARREHRGFPPQMDFCGYCGAANSSDDGSESYRNGWDCCYCGGN